MAFDYTEFLTEAQTILTEFGQTVTLREVSMTYNPRTGAVQPTNTDTSITMVNTPLEYEREGMSLAKAGDTQGIVAGALTFDSDNQYFIIMDSQTWDIIDDTPVRPAGTTILTRLHLRRSK